MDYKSDHPDIQVLRTLKRIGDEGAIYTEIVACMGATKARASSALHNLFKAGLVTRPSRRKTGEGSATGAVHVISEEGLQKLSEFDAREKRADETPAETPTAPVVTAIRQAFMAMEQSLLDRINERFSSLEDRLSQRLLVSPQRSTPSDNQSAVLNGLNGRP